MRAPRKPPRAETVGSLLRPSALRQVVSAVYEEGHTSIQEEERSKPGELAELHALEDEAIRRAIQRQMDCGLDVVTDGEYRRWMFLNSFYDAVSGVRTDKQVYFKNGSGDEVPLNVHEVQARLEVIASPAADEARFMREATNGYPFKITFPAPSIFCHPLTTLAGGYDSLEEFVLHAIEIEKRLVQEAVAQKVPIIQFDFPLYPYLVDPAWIGRFEAAGHDIAHVLDAAIAADLAVLEGLPDDVTTALHICRGNFRSSWMCEGSLEPVAERVFGHLPYDAFLVEWDDMGRDGGFEPIRFLRDGSVMVMGFVSSKVRGIEDEDDLVRRMEQAASIVGGLDRLAISPQCGFASVMVGNDIDEDVQWRKLELVGRVADRLWAD